MNRQAELLKLWNNRKKAIVINGHGVLSDPSHLKTVPPGVAVMFLSETGSCMNINTGLGVQNKFFRSQANFRNFLQGGRRNGVQYKHVTDILSRTHLPGNKYPDMDLHLEPNKYYPTMGYIKTVPMRHSRAVPTFRETRGPLCPKPYLLSKLLHQRKGIVVVSACRDNPNIPNNKKVFNLPTNACKTTSRKRQPRGTEYGNIIRRTPVFKARSGVTWLSMVQPGTRVYKKKVSRVKAFNKLRKSVYLPEKQGTFRNLLKKLDLPANMTLARKKEFELLRRHYVKPPKNMTTLRSGKQIGKN
jgi:hypothetical protein